MIECTQLELRSALAWNVWSVIDAYRRDAD